MSVEISKLSLKSDSDDAASVQSFRNDYIDRPFSGKQEQFEQVLDILDSTGFIPEALIESEANWFYTSLGIDDVFFARESPQGIASHIHSLYSCKVQAFAS
ncbi:hypothetical protein OXX69_013143, partial [Metschnikowia pulcherrima]